jgi:bifunctional non-homologous end joining protein LigD
VHRARHQGRLLIKHRDDFASTRDVLQDDRSVLSGLTIQDLKEGRMPRVDSAAGDGAPHPAAREAAFPDPKKLRPMLATLVERAFSREGWLFEPKLDGAMAFGATEHRAATRRGIAATTQYPEIARDLEAQDVTSAVFDGEIVAINEAGAPDFQELQARINLSKPAEVERAAAETPAYYYVFDVLYLDGYDLKNVPLSSVSRCSGILRRAPEARRVGARRRMALYGAASELGSRASSRARRPADRYAQPRLSR